MNDLEFAQKVLALSEEETRNFYKILANLVYALTNSSDFPIDDKNDLIHELYKSLVLDGKLKKYSGRAKLSTWLMVVVLRKIKDKMKIEANRRRILNEIDINNFLNSQGGFDPDIYDFRQAVNKLNEKEKQVVNLYIEGFKPSEIATLLGVRPRYVYKKLELAKKHLRRILNPREKAPVESSNITNIEKQKGGGT